MNFKLSFALFYLTISYLSPNLIVSRAVAQETATTNYIIGIDPLKLKVLKAGGKEFALEKAKDLIRSPRALKLSVKSKGRFERAIVKSFIKGDLSSLNNLSAKVVKNSRGLKDSFLAKAIEEEFVTYFQKDFTIKISKTSNDPENSKLWGLENTKDGFFSTANVDIDAPKAWDTSTGSKNVVVAVIDTGIDVTHPDLKDNLWRNAGEIAGNRIDDDGNGYVDDVNGCDFITFDTVSGKYCGEKPFQLHPHGTHVAGTIGAKGDNALGVSGINWNVSLLSLAFLNHEGAGILSDELEAFNYIIEMKRKFKRGQGGIDIKVVNASFGHNEGVTQPELDAIRILKDLGILLVVAAGNGGQDGLGDDNDRVPTYPSSYDVDNIISVAAVGQSGSLGYFSNYGERSVDLAAPGVGIFSAVFEGGFEEMSGTSMAAPHVTGVVALIYSYKPNMEPWLVKELILSTVKDKNSVPALAALVGKVATGGMLDANAALIGAGADLSKPRIDEQPVGQKVPIGSDISLSLRAFGGGALTYQWRRNGSPITGGTSRVLNLKSITKRDDAMYSCVVSSGSESVESSSVRVEVTDNIVGDVNSDGKIDYYDLIALFTQIGQKGPDLTGDVNRDGKVDLRDVQLLMKYIKYGSSYSPNESKATDKKAKKNKKSKKAKKSKKRTNKRR